MVFNLGSIRVAKKTTHEKYGSIGYLVKRQLQRWKKYDIDTNVYITRIGLKTDHKINVIKKKTDIPALISTIRVVEEKFKAEYHNTNRGFMWCVANTTLYFHKSSKCATCKFKNECKELLKEEYPKIYVKRGYGRKVMY